MKKTISELIRAERLRRGLSKSKCSIEIGISVTYLSQIEDGRTPAKEAGEKVMAWIEKKPG